MFDLKTIYCTSDHISILHIINIEQISYVIPKCSMYGIFTYIWVIFRANVGKYSIHGAYVILVVFPTGQPHIWHLAKGLLWDP